MRGLVLNPIHCDSLEPPQLLQEGGAFLPGSTALDKCSPTVFACSLTFRNWVSCKKKPRPVAGGRERLRGTVLAGSGPAFQCVGHGYTGHALGTASSIPDKLWVTWKLCPCSCSYLGLPPLSVTSVWHGFWKLKSCFPTGAASPLVEALGLQS